MRHALLALLFLAVSANAQPIADSAAALQSGQYMRAYTLDEALIKEMMLRPSTEPAAFAMVVAHKAIALAGLGQDEEARWYWSYAQALVPDIAESPDIAALGPGVALVRKPARSLAVGTLRVGGVVKAPVTISRVNPLYPEGARKLRVTGVVIVECIIDKSGVVREGRVLKNLPVPTLGYAAIEAVKQWKFKPATMDGEPVNVIFNLTINFKLSGDEERIASLAESAAALKGGAPVKALLIDERLIAQMMEQLRDNEPLFATAVAHKAAALAALGKPDEARWYWNLARDLDDSVATGLDLPGIDTLKQQTRLLPEALRVGGDVKYPVAVVKVEPVYPRGAQAADVAGIVMVEAWIDKTGAVREQKLLKGLRVPTLAYAAMEALRTWRFKPGTLNGEPVDTIYNLVISFPPATAP